MVWTVGVLALLIAGAAGFAPYRYYMWTGAIRWAAGLEGAPCPLPGLARDITSRSARRAV